MLSHLPQDFPFTVVTNSLKIAELIRSLSHIESYLIGGKLRTNGESMFDTVALEIVKKFNFDIAFLTGGGICRDGISTATPEGAAFARAVSELSRRTICLAPHEKLGVRMFAKTIPLQQIDLLITDQAPQKRSYVKLSIFM